MKSLELKALKMNDNFPLIISLNGKVEWELDDNKDIVDSHLVNRDDARCTFSTISQIMLYPLKHHPLCFDLGYSKSPHHS